MSKNKKTDENGFRTYDDCKFFCECIAQYLGREIDVEGKLGLKPNGIYNVYRPKSEIEKPDFVESLQAKPILDDHTVIGVGDGFVSPDKRPSAGVLTNVHVIGNELHGRVDVWSPSLIKKIDSGKRELSLAYACDFVRKSGEWNGEKYDFVQSNLRCGNHLAFVDEARNGHDCRVNDSTFTRDEKIQLEKPDMDITKLSADEVVEALKGCSDEVKAKCKDFLNTPTEEEQKAADEAKAKAEEEAKAAEEAKAKADDEAKAKVEQEKKDAVDAAVAEAEKKAEDKAEEAKKEAEAECAKACDAAIAEYKKAVALAEDCKARFGTIAMDGIKTEKDLAVKVCAMDSAPAFLKSVNPENAIVALKGCLAGSGAVVQKSIVEDAKSVKKTIDDFIK
jgi:uncharacterized protein